MSQFLKRLEKENGQQEVEEVKMQERADEDDDSDDEEEKGDQMSDVPLSHQPVMDLAASSQQDIASSGGNQSASAASSSGMPMPTGLFPVGNSVSSAPGGGAPRPMGSQFLSSGSAGGNALSALRNQYQPLPWTDFFDSTEKIEDTIPIYTAGTEGHIFLCLHGAGHSAMSFAAMAAIMKPTNTVIAFDWRGHGTHAREDEAQMSQQTLIAESIQVIQYVHEKYPNRTIILVGHSMGGAIATKTMHHLETEMSDSDLCKCILGVAIIDVVEGTAMEALPFMEQIVKNRPVSFPDLASVVKYGLLGGQVKDKKSARISMPAQVKEVTDEATGRQVYVWRTDLLATKDYWPEWFQGLTSTFLGLKSKKMLFLAGAERQDTELTIAHMQGKYEMHVIADCGHVIQEDQPAQLCSKIMEFIERRKIPTEWNKQMFIVTAGGKKVFINN